MFNVRFRSEVWCILLCTWISSGSDNSMVIYIVCKLHFLQVHGHHIGHQSCACGFCRPTRTSERSQVRTIPAPSNGSSYELAKCDFVFFQKVCKLQVRIFPVWTFRLIPFSTDDTYRHTFFNGLRICLLCPPLTYFSTASDRMIFTINVSCDSEDLRTWASRNDLPRAITEFGSTSIMRSWVEKETFSTSSHIILSGYQCKCSDKLDPWTGWFSKSCDQRTGKATTSPVCDWS